MGERPRPTLLQLVKVNFFPLGLEFISGSSMTFVVPSLMSSELRSDVVAIVLGSGSLLAMIMGPKIGAWSDIHENSKNGKRTPFILGISVVVLISLLLIPYSVWISSFLPERYAGLMHLGLLFLGIILMDAGVNLLYTPFEALLDDMYGHNAVQRAFGIKSLMVSLGGCLAYLLCAIDMNALYLSHIIGGADRFLFLVLFFIFLLTTLIALREIKWQHIGSPEKEGIIDWGSFSLLFVFSNIYKVPLLLFKIPVLIRGIFSSILELIQSLMEMPKVFNRLWLSNFCCWMGLMSLTVYYTEFFGEVIYNGDPTAEKGSLKRMNYEEGLRMGSVGLFLQNAVGMITAFFADDIIYKFGKRKTYLLASTSFAISTGIIFISRNVPIVIICTGITGLLLTAVQVIPYSLLSQYHKDTAAYLDPDGLDWNRGLCEIYALLDSAYYLSHLVPIIIVSALVQISSSPLSYAACSAVFGCFGVISLTQVFYDRTDFTKSLQIPDKKFKAQTARLLNNA